MRKKLLAILFLLRLISESISGAAFQVSRQSCGHLDRTFRLFPLSLNAKEFCPKDAFLFAKTLYILYDTNPAEGFNLRRDVYIRLSVFVRRLAGHPSFQHVRLVLPPWKQMYHWRSMHIQQDNLSWSHFFDMESLRRFAPVLDFHEFIDEVAQVGSPQAPFILVNKVYQLLHFKEMFENGEFHEKYEFDNECVKSSYMANTVLQQPILANNHFQCVRFQGGASILKQILLTDTAVAEPKVIAFLNSEVVLHDRWGDSDYWKARRSMRFSSHLVGIADSFRLLQLNSTNTVDKVQRPPMWEEERPYRNAVGGSYLCAHVRRGDFILGRKEITPTLISVADQIKSKMNKLQLKTVFLATDASAMEVKQLISHMPRIRVARFRAESHAQKLALKDGGIAIIDQIICSHARYFIGTYESTFTYRIYEEREILGFPIKSTFNTFCKVQSMENCKKNSIWPIAY